MACASSRWASIPQKQKPKRCDRKTSAGADGFTGAGLQIDVRGLLSREPPVRARQAFSGLASGGTAHVVATDPHAEIDFEALARRTPNDLLRREWKDGEFHVLIRKG